MKKQNFFNQTRWPLLISYALLLFAFTWACYRFWSALGYNLEVLNDEAINYVAAKMLTDGGRLYQDVFTQHGPLAFIFSQLALLITGSADYHTQRIALFLFYLLVAFSLYLSPIFETKSQRVLSTSIFLALLGSFSFSWSGHMVLYHNLAGGFFLIFLVQFLMPLLWGRPTKRAGEATAGTAFVLTFFAAYSYVVSLFFGLLICVIVLYDREHKINFSKVLPFLSGCGLALALLFAWFAWSGDLAGYVVYHFYLNQVVFADIISFSLFDTLKQFSVFLFNPFKTHSLYSLFSGVLVVSITCIFLKIRQSRRPLYVNLTVLLLLLLTTLYLNPRGMGTFGAAASYMGICGLFSVSIVSIFGFRLQKKGITFALSVSAIFLFFLSFSAKQGITGYVSSYALKETKLARLIHPSRKKVVNYIRSKVLPGETIGVYPYDPTLYLETDRMPASGAYYYLYFQSEYAKQPLFSMDIDLCEDLKKNKPRIIYFDNRPINRSQATYYMSDYAPCFISLMNERYDRRGLGVFEIKQGK